LDSHREGAKAPQLDSPARAIAATISPNLALMMFSTSRLAADGEVTARRRFSSSIDKVYPQPPATFDVGT